MMIFYFKKKRDILPFSNLFYDQVGNVLERFELSRVASERLLELFLKLKEPFAILEKYIDDYGTNPELSELKFLI
jgi:hypothetical protein